MQPKVMFAVIDYPNRKPDRQAEIRQAIREMAGNAAVEQVFYPETITEAAQGFELLKACAERDAEALVLYIPTFVWASRFTQFLRVCPVPIVLWAEDQIHNVPLEGLTVVHGSLEQIGKKHWWLYGSPDDRETVEKMHAMLYAAHAVFKLARARFGLFGGRSMGMNTGCISTGRWLGLFGIDVKQIEQGDVIRAAEKVEAEEVSAFYEGLKARFGSVVPLDTRFDHAIRLYFGLEKVLAENRLDFSAVKCIFDISDNYASACLAQSLVNERGFVSACCGESNVALTMYALRQLCGEAMVQVDIAYADRKSNTLLLGSDGACSPAVAACDKCVDINYQYGIESKAGGVCTSLTGKDGRVTVAKFGERNGRYILNIATGTAYSPEDPALLDRDNKNWPRVYVRLDGDIDRFIEHNMGQYAVCCYGDQARALSCLAGYYDIPVYRA